MLDTRLSDQGAVALHTMNPGPPGHHIKKLIDREEELGYGSDGRKELASYRFILDENTFLDPAYIASLKKKYPKGTVLYKRFIEGLWVSAEGRVFPFFEEDPEHGYIVNSVPDHFIEFLVGLDYGISNPFVATLWGLSGGVWYILQEFNWDSVKQQKQKSNPDYIEDLSRLITWNGKPVFPKKILVPPEENGFIRDLKRAGQTRPNICGVDAADNKIMPGIEDLTTLFAVGRLKILGRNCPATVHGFMNLLWDAEKQEQGIDMYTKGGSGSPDHACDANRYIGRQAAKTLRQMGLIL